MSAPCTWVEPFAGAAACALRLVGGRDLTPPVAGWHSIELTREGGKPEWLTLSRPPARLPARQGVLFGGTP